MLKPGDTAQDFDLPAAISGARGRVVLSRVRRELVVLFFYVHDFSFICPTEVKGFQEELARFRAEDAEVIGVSVDDVETHLRWSTELGGIDYPLVADPGGKLASVLGVFDESEGTALRATYVLGRRGEVLYAVASQANIGRGVHETLRVVQALRCGRECPADWQPESEMAP